MGVRELHRARTELLPPAYGESVARSRRTAIRCATAVGCVFLASACSVRGSNPSTGASSGPQRLASGQCKTGDPLAGVYFPSRLTVKDACTTVKGTVDCVVAESDGDIHIRLRPDPAFQHLLTAANAVQQCSGQPEPHLVVEIIPQTGHLPFPENSADRGGFTTPAAPAVGEHVSVTGPLVWDSNVLHDLVHPGHDTKNWAEIHPAWNISPVR